MRQDLGGPVFADHTIPGVGVPRATASGVIGVLVADLTDPCSARIIDGVQHQIFLADHLALVCSTGDDPLREIAQLERLRRLRARGVILVGGGVRGLRHRLELSKLLKDFLRRGAEVVLCGRPPLPGLPQATAITFDNIGGTIKLIEFLTGLGHRRIGYLTGPSHDTATRERLRGFRTATREHDPSLVVEGAVTWDSGWRGSQELLRHNEVTAIVAANDLMARGALAAARALGHAVPGQLSVAGFGDAGFCRDTRPPLTTVRLPLQEAGAEAGRLACGIGVRPRTGVLRLGSDLVVRRTTGVTK
jgi:LacI family transcriptional regulator